jgi:hypothetical protein
MSNLIPVTDDSNPVSAADSSLVGQEYEGLFRPEIPQELPVEEAFADPLPPEGDQPASTPSETGRIFRSQGVSGHDDALIAIPLQKSGRLRTLTRDSQRESIGVLDAEIALPPATANVPGIAMHAPAPIPSPRTSSREERKPTSGSRSELVGSLSAPWVYLIAISVTLVFGLGNVLIFGGEPGLLAGIGLLLATLFTSFAVRSSDDIHAIYAPAISFFIMAATIGQINIADSSIINRGVAVFFILGNNWIWVIGSTVIALVIVALRRRSIR